MLRLMNSWKLSIATVRGDANPLDAATDAMDSPTLLHVAQGCQTENCDNPNNTQEVDTEEEDDNQNWMFYGQRCLCIRW